MLYGVKVRETRQYKRVGAESRAEAIASLGLTENDVTYVLLVEMPKPPMSEEVKAKLNEINKQRRSLRRKGE